MSSPDQPDRSSLSQTPRISLTPSQKWAEVNRLRKLAWDLKYASVKQSHPDWSDEQIRKRVRDIFLYATT